MKSVGIICECNPFHEGHRYLIERARAGGADCVVCVMSGYFTQRGEAAIANPYSRASALLFGGADLVLELPYPYCSASAEFFAAAGVNILARMAVDELWFGSECGDIDLLTRAAETAQDADFLHRYAQCTSSTGGTAQAYFECLRACMGNDVTLSSNDILAIAYLCAIQKQGWRIKPVTVRREGSAYLETELSEGCYPSATALRTRLLSDGLEATEPYLIPQTAKTLREAIGCRTAPAALAFAERALLAYLRMQAADDVERIAELEGGLGNRLLRHAMQAETLDQLIAMTATKKYTTSRIQRGILFALTGVGKEDLRAELSYVRVLAANAVGCACLARQRRDPSLITATRQGEIPTHEQASRQEELHRRAVGLYGMCLKTPIDATMFLRKNPMISK